MDFIKIFITGGVICFLGQFLLTKLKLNPPQMLTTVIIAGGLLEILGLYDYIAAFGEEGSQVQIIGFGAIFGKAVKTGVDTKGILGIFMFTNIFYKILGLVTLVAVVVSIISAMYFSSKREKAV